MREEFTQFMTSERRAPQVVLEKVESKIQRNLEFAPSLLLLKLLLIQIVIGGLTLAFCPQFNLTWKQSPILESSLVRLMQLHPLLCAAFCGAFFVGSSTLIASLVLNRQDLFLSRRHGFWMISVLVGASLAFFMIAGNAQQHHHNLFNFIWAIAALVVGYMLFKIPSYLRLNWM